MKEYEKANDSYLFNLRKSLSYFNKFIFLLKLLTFLRLSNIIIKVVAGDLTPGSTFFVTIPYEYLLPIVQYISYKHSQETI